MTSTSCCSATGSSPGGFADARTWQRIAGHARRRGRLLGVDPRAFPADFAVFARYTSALRSLPHSGLLGSPLAVEDALAGLRGAEKLSVVGGD